MSYPRGQKPLPDGRIALDDEVPARSSVNSNIAPTNTPLPPRAPRRSIFTSTQHSEADIQRARRKEAEARRKEAEDRRRAIERRRAHINDMKAQRFDRRFIEHRQNMVQLQNDNVIGGVHPSFFRYEHVDVDEYVAHHRAARSTGAAATGSNTGEAPTATSRTRTAAATETAASTIGPRRPVARQNLPKRGNVNKRSRFGYDGPFEDINPNIGNPRNITTIVQVGGQILISAGVYPKDWRNPTIINIPILAAGKFKKFPLSQKITSKTPPVGIFAPHSVIKATSDQFYAAGINPLTGKAETWETMTRKPKTLAQRGEGSRQNAGRADPDATLSDHKTGLAGRAAFQNFIQEHMPMIDPELLMQDAERFGGAAPVEDRILFTPSPFRQTPIDGIPRKASKNSLVAQYDSTVATYFAHSNDGGVAIQVTNPLDSAWICGTKAQNPGTVQVVGLIDSPDHGNCEANKGTRQANQGTKRSASNADISTSQDPSSLSAVTKKRKDNRGKAKTTAVPKGQSVRRVVAQIEDGSSSVTTKVRKNSRAKGKAKEASEDQSSEQSKNPKRFPRITLIYNPNKGKAKEAPQTVTQIQASVATPPTVAQPALKYKDKASNSDIPMGQNSVIWSANIKKRQAERDGTLLKSAILNLKLLKDQSVDEGLRLAQASTDGQPILPKGNENGRDINNTVSILGKGNDMPSPNSFGRAFENGTETAAVSRKGKEKPNPNTFGYSFANAENGENSNQTAPVSLKGKEKPNPNTFGYTFVDAENSGNGTEAEDESPVFL